MTAPPPVTDGPCAPWPIDPQCACPDWPDNDEDWTPQHHVAADVATEILFSLTAGRYGTCLETIRPCQRPCDQPPAGGGGWSLRPYIDNGRWFNSACGCTDGCHCGNVCKVRVPGPVKDIVEVKLDGQVLDPAAYTLWRRPGATDLVRIPGQGRRPVRPIVLTVNADPADPARMSILAAVDNAGYGNVHLDFGDGSEPIPEWPENVPAPHTYSRAGTYTLTATGPGPDGSDCWPPLTLSVTPGGDTPRMDAVARVDNAGLGPADVDWGDGSPPSTGVPEDAPVTHTYAAAGRYTLIATAPERSCPDEDGAACWPYCQNLTAPDTEPGTFSVTYLRGRDVPAAGIRAVSSLACEIYKQCTGASGCRLPERVTTIQREGVTYQLVDPGEWLDTGRTGLTEVDAWLSLVNPRGLRQPPAVYSLDTGPAPLVTHRGGLPL